VWSLPVAWKEQAALLVRKTPLKRLLPIVVRLVVPRHRIGVGGVVIDNAGKILLLRHVFHPANLWGLPGGWLNRHEDPAAGALRELAEETNLQATVGSLVYSCYDLSPPHLGLAFLLHATPGPLTLSNEIIEADWFAPGRFPGPLLPFTLAAIEAALTVWGEARDKPSLPASITE